MNVVRVWVLRLASIAVVVFGGFLLYDSYQDLSWSGKAIADAGSLAYAPGHIQDRIVAESAEKEKSGKASQNAGLLLIAAGLIMEGVASVLANVGRLSSADKTVHTAAPL